MLARWKVLTAMAGAASFSAEELARRSGVNSSTVRTVLRRDAAWLEPVGSSRTQTLGAPEKRQRVKPELVESLRAKIREAQLVLSGNSFEGVVDSMASQQSVRTFMAAAMEALGAAGSGVAEETKELLRKEALDNLRLAELELNSQTGKTSITKSHLHDDLEKARLRVLATAADVGVGASLSLAASAPEKVEASTTNQDDTIPEYKIRETVKIAKELVYTTSSIGNKTKFGVKTRHHDRSGGLQLSQFSLQLREKQKVKRVYGVLERQFRRYFAEAERRTGNTGENLLFLLESRLDNVVYRMGFGSTRAEARQMVSHKAVLVNGQVVNVASYLVKAGDVVAIREKGKGQLRVKDAMNLAQRAGIADFKAFKIMRIAREPSSAEATSDDDDLLFGDAV